MVMPFDDEFESINDDTQAEYDSTSEAKLVRKQYLPLDSVTIHERDLSSFSEETEKQGIRAVQTYFCCR